MKKVLLVLSLSLVTYSSLRAQANYADSLAKAKELLLIGDFEMASAKADALTTLNKSRADGYLLHAIIQIKQNNLEKARLFISKAEGKQSTDETFTEDFVKKALKDKEAANVLSETARAALASGNKNTAADIYLEAYLRDQHENVQYATEAYKLYLAEKDFVKALKVLTALKQSTSGQNIELAEKLEGSLRALPEFKQENEFNEYMSQGLKHAENKQYPEALEYFKKAALVKPNSPLPRERMARTQEQIAFENALSQNRSEAFEKYLQEYPLGIHRAEALAKLAVSYLNAARNFVAKNDFAGAEKQYKKYEITFPDGADIQTVSTELCNLYSKEARRLETMKTAEALEKAIDYYKQAQTCNKDQPGAEYISRLSRKQKRWARPDHFFLGWHASTNAPFGISGAMLRNRKTGLYFAVRANKEFPSASSDTYWKTNDQNSLENSQEKDKIFTGTRIERVLQASVGLTRKIAHPVWLYTGLGVALNGEIREFRTADGTIEKVTNMDAGYTALNPEIGIQVKLGPLGLGYGINKPLNEKYTGKIVSSIRIGLNIK